MSRKENRLARRRLRNAYLSTVISISLVLLLVGVASLLLVNAKSVSDYFKENLQVSVLLRQQVGDKDAQKLQAVLDGSRFVRSTRFVSREEGEREMQSLLGEDFLSAFDVSPVPASIDVTLKAEYVSSDSLAMVKAEIEKSPLVDEVSYQQSLIDLLNANLGRISLVLGVLIVLLMFISFVLINNTVRLNVFSRRFTIHTMKLVGATRAFIRAPFLGRSVLQGLVSALLALALLAGVLYFVKAEFPQLIEIVTPRMLVTVAVTVVLSGVLICLLSTYFVVNKLVGMDKDDLYY